LARAARLAAVILIPACSSDTGEGDQPSSHTVRVSETNDGTQANGNCQNPAVSGDGRIVAFETVADLLTPDDANGLRDILVKDRTTGLFENVTLIEGGTLLNGPVPDHCYNPSISSDGRYVAFASAGYYNSNIVPPRGKRTVWRYDRITREFRAINADAAWPDEDADYPVLSADGRFVAFVSFADNLIPGVTCSDLPQIWVADFASTPPAINLISRDKDFPLVPADGWCGNAQISADGNAVVFYGGADNLHADTNTLPHVYISSPPGAPAELVSRDSGGAPLDGSSSQPSVSADGRIVAFQTLYSTALPETAVVLRDRVAGTLVVAADDAGRTGSQPLSFQRCSLSADGRYVAYASGPMGGTHVIRVRDMGATAPVTVSVHLSGSLPLLTCVNPALSADGRWAVWESKDRTLVTDDTNGYVDVFTRGPLR
jgi:Tol biopolymer transport system component